MSIKNYKGLFYRRKLTFGSLADRADIGIGQGFEGSARFDVLFFTTYCGIIDVAAYIANILFHNHQGFWSSYYLNTLMDKKVWEYRKGVLYLQINLSNRQI